MDDSILSRFPDDDHVLGPFLGNLPPEILDVVVRKLGWFQTTFALAAKTCREAVDRVPSAVLTEEERERLEWSETSPLAVAAMEADVEALEWLIQLFEAKRLNWLDVGTGLSCLAAGRGKLESLTCLRANGCPWDRQTCAYAAKGGHLEVLQWARENGCPWDNDTCMHAAEGGHLEVLQWARRNGCGCDQFTCAKAAERGDLNMLQWAHQNGCPWDAYTCSNAAYGGHLEVLQWARRNWCPWDERTCEYAASGGHLEVLRWARQNGCPWDQNSWYFAESNCRAYLREHGCPGAT